MTTKNPTPRTPTTEKSDTRVFLPHIGLGDSNMVRIMLPTLLYNDPLPLLLFDKVLIDRSVYFGFDSDDEFEQKLLNELVKRGIIEVVPFAEQTTLDKRHYKLFADLAQEVDGITLLPKRIAIRDIDDEQFMKSLSDEGRDLRDLFAVFSECYLSLQITRDHQIPMIRSDWLQLALTAYLLSTDKRRKLHKAISPESLAYEGLRHTVDIYGPTVPLMTTTDGTQVPPVPIFLRSVGFSVTDEDKQLDERRSWANVDKLTELRQSPLLDDFRKYIREISAALSTIPGDGDVNESIKKEHTKRLLELQQAIAQEYEWLRNFTKVSGYLSVPLGLAGFGAPALGIASARMAVGSVTAELTRNRLMKQRERAPEFHESHPEFRWRLFLADLESRYARNDFLKLMKQLLQ